MEITHHTRARFVKYSLTPAQVQSIKDNAAVAQEQGKTDGSEVIQPSDTPEEAYWVRGWSSQEAALEWVVFLETLNPISVEIVNHLSE